MPYIRVKVIQEQPPIPNTHGACSGRLFAPATRRDFPAVSVDPPGTGGQLLCEQRRFRDLSRILDLRLSNPGFDWGGWFTGLEQRRARRLSTDDNPVYGPALKETGLDRQQCAVHMQRTVGRHIQGLDEDAPTHLDRILLVLWEAMRQERVRLKPECEPRCNTLWNAGAT